MPAARTNGPKVLTPGAPFPQEETASFAEVPRPAPLVPILQELPSGPITGEAEPPPQPPIVPYLPGGTPAPTPRRRQWFERWSPRVLVAIMTTAVAAALTLLAITFSRGHHEVQLMITSIPTGADIFINGERQPPKTDATIRGLKPGSSYELRIEKEGYEPASRLVAIPKETRTYVVEVKLDQSH
jgi:hypothetical protein